MSRIGIMGGTFNPIHIGHLMLAEQALESAHLDQVWMIPTGCSYLKTKEGISILPGTERYDMVQLAIADNDRFRCLDIEIKRPEIPIAMRPWSCCTENIRNIFFISSAELTACLPWNNGNAQTACLLPVRL